jgi:hypothetical protein
LGRFNSVKWFDRMFSPSSSQASGTDTGAPSRARVE